MATPTLSHSVIVDLQKRALAQTVSRYTGRDNGNKPLRGEVDTQQSTHAADSSRLSSGFIFRSVIIYGDYIASAKLSPRENT
jgi:hypothetical protein